MQCIIWNYISALFVSCYIKIHWFTLNFGWFLTSYNGHLGNTDSLVYTVLSSVNTFHYMIFFFFFFKSHLLISTFISSEKSLSVGNLSSLQWWIQVFQNSNFSWKLVFYHWKQTFILLETTGWLGLVFEKIPVKFPSLKTHSLVSFFQVKMVFHVSV